MPYSFHFLVQFEHQAFTAWPHILIKFTLGEKDSCGAHKWLGPGFRNVSLESASGERASVFFAGWPLSILVAPLLAYAPPFGRGTADARAVFSKDAEFRGSWLP